MAMTDEEMLNFYAQNPNTASATSTAAQGTQQYELDKRNSLTQQQHSLLDSNLAAQQSGLATQQKNAQQSASVNNTFLMKYLQQAQQASGLATGQTGSNFINANNAYQQNRAKISNDFSAQQAAILRSYAGDKLQVDENAFNQETSIIDKYKEADYRAERNAIEDARADKALNSQIMVNEASIKEMADRLKLDEKILEQSIYEFYENLKLKGRELDITEKMTDAQIQNMADNLQVDKDTLAQAIKEFDETMKYNREQDAKMESATDFGRKELDFQSLLEAYAKDGFNKTEMEDLNKYVENNDNAKGYLQKMLDLELKINPIDPNSVPKDIATEEIAGTTAEELAKLGITTKPLNIYDANVNSFGSFRGTGAGEKQDAYTQAVIEAAKAGKIPDGTIISMNYGSALKNKGYYTYYKGAFYKLEDKSSLEGAYDSDNFKKLYPEANYK